MGTRNVNDVVGAMVIRHLKSAGLDCVLHDCRADEESYFGLKVGVVPGTVDEAYEKFHGNIEVKVNGKTVVAHVMFEPMVPKLVDASLGDWVMMYSDFKDKDEWPIGLVTSIRRQGNKKAYGVRHVCPISWLDHPMGYDELVKLSEEDYGGLPTGFVMVLSEEEALSVIEKRVRKAAEERIEKIRLAIPKIVSVVQWMKKSYDKKVTIERLQKEDLRPKSPMIQKST